LSGKIFFKIGNRTAGHPLTAQQGLDMRLPAPPLNLTVAYLIAVASYTGSSNALTIIHPGILHT
jgi:hypothetical protein